MSTAPLFFVKQLPYGDVFELGGDEGRHAARVRRIEVGEAIHVGDGWGVVLECVVSGVLLNALELTVVTRRVVAAPDPWLTVVQAVPKGERAERAVELMTELGVDDIAPWGAARSVAQWRGSSRRGGAIDRWERVAREAAKQSRRAYIPRIMNGYTSEFVCGLLQEREVKASLVLHESAELSLVDVPLPSTGTIAIIVGPEGGISPQELDMFTHEGAVPVRMGTPIMRSSTAGAAALAALSVRLGRWS